MAQAVGCQFLSAEFRVRSQVSACWFCGGQSGTGGGGGGFSPRFSPVSTIPAMLRPPIYLHVALTGRTKYRCVGTFLKQCYFGNRDEIQIKILSHSFLNVNIISAPHEV
jgi:hypothetical protein